MGGCCGGVGAGVVNGGGGATGATGATGPAGATGATGATGGSDCCLPPVDSISSAGITLAALDTTGIADGITIWVRSVEDVFVLNRGAALTADGITIVTGAVGGGQWRRRNVPSQTWLHQATWFIDSVGGSDDADGATAGTPLRTHAELERRAFGHGATIFQDTTVTITSAGLPETDRVRVNVKQVLGVTLTYLGLVVAPPLRTGTLTGATATTPAAQIQQLIEDTVGGPFTAEVNERIIMTTGPAAGAIAWIAADLDPGVPDTARTSTFATLAGGLPAIVRPLAGDSYLIESLPTIFLESVHVSTGDTAALTPGLGIIFRNFVVSTQTVSGFLPLPNGPFEFCTFIGCKLTSFLAQHFIGVVAMSVTNAGFFLDSDINYFATLHLALFGSGPSQLWQACKLAFGAEVLAQNGPLFERGSPFLIPAGFFGSNDNAVEFVNLGGEPSFASGSTFDSTSDGMSASEDCSVIFRSFYFGDGNTGVGIRMTGKSWYDASIIDFKPTVTGAGGDTSIGGVVTPYAGIPFVNFTNLSQLVILSEVP